MAEETAKASPRRRRRAQPEHDGPTAPAAPLSEVSHPSLLSLQRQTGNQAVTQLLQRKANPDADFASAATIMSRIGAGDAKELQEWYKQVATAFSASSAAILKAAKHVAKLTTKNGSPLFKELMHVAPSELEVYWMHASSLSKKHPRLAHAVLLVRGFRDPKAGLEIALTEIGDDLPGFLANVPAADVRKTFKDQTLFRLLAMLEHAKDLREVRDQIAFTLFDKLLAGSEAEALEFANELTDKERWNLYGYLYGEFTTKYSKGRDVRNRLSPGFQLTIDGHAKTSKRVQ